MFNKLSYELIWSASSCGPGDTRAEITGNPGQWGAVCSPVDPNSTTFPKGKKGEDSRALSSGFLFRLYNSSRFIPACNLGSYKLVCMPLHTPDSRSPGKAILSLYPGSIFSVQTRYDAYTGSAGLEWDKLLGLKFGQTTILFQETWAGSPQSQTQYEKS